MKPGSFDPDCFFVNTEPVVNLTFEVSTLEGTTNTKEIFKRTNKTNAKLKFCTFSLIKSIYER
jgi:hypothetical protein